MSYRTPDGLCVDIALFTIIWDKSNPRKVPTGELGVFLSRRNNEHEPFHGCWALPGGFTTPDESIEQVAYRKLNEKVGLHSDIRLHQLDVRYAPDRDPRGWIPTITFFALVDEEKLKKAKVLKNVSEVSLFPLSQVRDMELAFDHADIIENAERHMLEQFCTTNMVRELLPNEFTLSQLYNVVKIVIPNFNVSKTNFFRDMTNAKMKQQLIQPVMDGDEFKKTTSTSGPEATLYTFSEKYFIPSIFSKTIIRD